MAGTVRSVGGVEWGKYADKEDAKVKMVEQFNSYYPSCQQAENYFMGPFTVAEDCFLFSDNGRAVQKKCASFETVLVFKDATGEVYRRFIYRPDY